MNSFIIFGQEERERERGEEERVRVIGTNFSFRIALRVNR